MSWVKETGLGPVYYEYSAHITKITEQHEVMEKWKHDKYSVLLVQETSNQMQKEVF